MYLTHLYGGCFSSCLLDLPPPPAGSYAPLLKSWGRLCSVTCSYAGVSLLACLSVSHSQTNLTDCVRQTDTRADRQEERQARDTPA